MPDEISPFDLPPGEFNSFLSTLKQPAPESRPALQLAPETQKALEAGAALVQLQVPRDYVSPEGARLGVRPGHFLNTSEGASLKTRLRMGFDENLLNQFSLLEKQYPGNVSISPEGRLMILNQPDATGGTQDIFANPPGPEGGDIAQIASQALPIFAGLLGARGGASLVKGGTAKAVMGILGMAAGQELTGAAQDYTTRLLRGDPINLSEIAKHRLALAGMDIGAGAAFAGGAKASTKLLEGAFGLAGQDIGQTATEIAQRALAKRTGVKYKLSPGQAAESPFLKRIESMAGSRPGSAGVIDDISAAQQTAEDELRRVFHGVDRTLSDEELANILPQSDIVGERALGTLRTYAKGLESDVTSAQKAIQSTATQEVQTLAKIDLTNPLAATKVGETVRSRALGEFNQFRSTMGQRYDQFLSKPQIQSRTLPGDDLAKAAQKIEDKFTPGVDVGGGDVMRLDAFVNGKVKTFLNELKGLSGGTVSVNDLKQIRTGIDNAIAEGIAIPGVDTAQLQALRQSVDDNITTALKGIDPKLLSEWQSLKTDYAQGMSRFDKTGIKELLIKEGERGSLGNAAITERILGNSANALDNYNAYKTFLGASSPEFKNLQQVARENILRGALDDLAGYVDGPLLRARLSSDSLRREIADDLFGISKNELNRIGDLLQRSTKAKLDTGELFEAASQSGSLTASKIQSLIDAETTRATAYNNKLIKAAASGTIDAEKIRASDFVRYATRMDPKEAQKVLGVLSSQPDLLSEIRQNAIEELWGKVQAGTYGQKTMQADLLDKALGTGPERDTMRLILGNDTVESLQELNKVLAADSIKKGAFGSAIAGANDLAAIALHGEVGALRQLASRYLLAVIYAGPLKTVATNLFKTQDRGRLLNAIISSTPFIENLISHFGSDGSSLIMDALRRTVEPIQQKELFIEGKIKEGNPTELSPEEFKKWMENNVAR